MRLRRIGIFILLAALWLVCTATAAGAVDSASNAVAVNGEHVVTVPMWIWTLIVGTVIPLIVGLLTKLNAKPGVKIIINLVLAAISGVIGTAVVADGVAKFSTTAVVLAGLSLVQSIATYLGIWKPLESHSKLLPNAGLG